VAGEDEAVFFADSGCTDTASRGGKASVGELHHRCSHGPLLEGAEEDPCLRSVAHLKKWGVADEEETKECWLAPKASPPARASIFFCWRPRSLRAEARRTPSLPP